MKIGILTQTLGSNYGGLLQNYALQQILIRAGHQVETVDHGYRHPFIEILSIIKKNLQYLFNPKSDKPGYRPNKKELAIIRANTNQFINNYILHTPQMHSYSDFRKNAERQEYDAYVVGSDQCWRPLYNRFLYAMFLNFVADNNTIKRVAYAASFGVDKWEMSPKQTAKCSELASKFDLITVRESDAVNLCKKYLKVDARMVLDPTLLLDRVDYEALISRVVVKRGKRNLFYYFLDPSPRKLAFAKALAKEKSMDAFTTAPITQSSANLKETIKGNIDDLVYPPVEEWIQSFADAELVITDSFHGMVFSIIFNKPFWVIGNRHRGQSRFISLLSLFGLQERLLNIDDLQKIDITKEINWEDINNKRKELAIKSKDLLLSTLQ